jgi:hypothetical protein
MIEQGAHITDYDVIDYNAWAREGLDGYRKSVSPENFRRITDLTYNINKDTEDLRKLYNTPNFKFIKKRLAWNDVVRNFQKPGICDLTINIKLLDNSRSSNNHRVILLDITTDEVVFHDSDNKFSGANRREPLGKFVEAFESVPDGAELCRYSLT